MAWRIQNLSAQAIEIVGTWVPHGRLRADRRELIPPVVLPPNQSERLEFDVACQEDPGAVVENAFIILTVRWREEPWRIFARLTVTCGNGGRPETRTEAITTQGD